LESSHRALLTSLSVLLVANGMVGIVLLAIPYSGPEYVEGEKIDDLLMEGTGTMSYVNLRWGTYEVWAKDIDPNTIDYDSLELEMEHHLEPLDVERPQKEVHRELDGTRYEMVCRFKTTHSDSYACDYSINGPELNGTSVELLYMRQVTHLDRPTFLAGLALTVIAAVCVPIIYFVVKRRPRKPTT